MKKRLILAFCLLVAVITLTTAFIPTNENNSDLLEDVLPSQDDATMEPIGR